MSRQTGPGREICRQKLTKGYNSECPELYQSIGKRQIAQEKIGHIHQRAIHRSEYEHPVNVEMRNKTSRCHHHDDKCFHRCRAAVTLACCLWGALLCAVSLLKLKTTAHTQQRLCRPSGRGSFRLVGRGQGARKSKRNTTTGKRMYPGASHLDFGETSGYMPRVGTYADTLENVCFPVGLG